jgi:hypothetical protein
MAMHRRGRHGFESASERASEPVRRDLCSWTRPRPTATLAHRCVGAHPGGLASDRVGIIDAPLVILELQPVARQLSAPHARTRHATRADAGREGEFPKRLMLQIIVVRAARGARPAARGPRAGTERDAHLRMVLLDRMPIFEWAWWPGLQLGKPNFPNFRHNFRRRAERLGWFRRGSCVTSEFS